MTRKLKEARLSAEVQSLCRAVCSPTWWVACHLTSYVVRGKGQRGEGCPNLTDSSVLILSVGKRNSSWSLQMRSALPPGGRRSTKGFDGVDYIAHPRTENCFATIPRTQALDADQHVLGNHSPKQNDLLDCFQRPFSRSATRDPAQRPPKPAGKCENANTTEIRSSCRGSSKPPSCASGEREGERATLCPAKAPRPCRDALRQCGIRAANAWEPSPPVTILK